MNELIFITAAYRLDNLKAMAKSLVEAKSYIKDTHIVWLICLDQYNGFGDPSPAYEICGANGIDWLAVPSGKPNQKNYGGDMFNEPLMWYVQSYFNGTDPWIYVYDDDNLICPIMAGLIDKMLNTAEEQGKSIIWMSKMYGDGEFTYIRKEEAFASNDTYNLWAHLELPDPSQLIIRYSYLYYRLGMYDTIGSTYDIKFWNQLAQIYHDDILFPEDWGHPKGVFAEYFQCTHNGLAGDERKKKIEDTISEDKAPYFYFGSCSYEHENNIIEVPRELASKIYKMIEEYKNE